MTLPIILSVPHAGSRIPEEVADLCRLTDQQIREDGDEGAEVIYALQDEVAAFVSTDVPRAIVDLNRAPDDRSADGVVKTHTIWGEAVYRSTPDRDVVDRLLKAYYFPYHQRLTELATERCLFAVDGHTMAANAPPVAPKPGSVRPEVCLGNDGGRSCPTAWTDVFMDAFREAFREFRVTLNEPFSGGYITRTHGREMPWIQLELSRSNFLPPKEKRSRVLAALRAVCDQLT